jgi:TolB protein
MRLIMWILLSLSLVCCSASNQQDTQLMPTTLQKTPSAESVPNDSGVGEFFAASDVGNPKVVGATEYDANSQEFSLSAGGINMWGKRDEMQFVYKQLQGDFILRAQIKFIGQGTDPHRKLGWIVRRSLNAESAQVSAVVHGDGLTSLQFRNTDSADTEQIESTESSPNVIQLEVISISCRLPN